MEIVTVAGGQVSLSQPSGLNKNRSFNANPAAISKATWPGGTQPTYVAIKVFGAGVIQAIFDQPDDATATTALGVAEDAATPATNTTPYEVLDNTDGWREYQFTAAIANVYFKTLSGAPTAVRFRAV